MSQRFDVVVVGAGFSGLAAADLLHRGGHSVVVLEAQDRVGGKVESMVDTLGDRFDSGGQYVADEMDAVIAMVQRAGAALWPSHPGGRPITVPDRWHLDWDAGEAACDAIADRGLPQPDIWFAEWLESQPLTEGARAAARSLTNGQLCMDHGLVGVAQLVEGAARTPPLAEELQYSVLGTMHSLAEWLAAPLDVRRGCAVSRIVRTDDVLLVHAGEVRLEAAQVIVAVPPSVIPTITFEPPLSSELLGDAAAFVPGDVTKVRLRYSQPFWRESGLSGTVRFCEPYGLYVADASVADAHALVVFIGGPLAARWRQLGDDARLQRVLAAVTDALGPAAAEPFDVQTRDWQPDEFGAGGYSQIVQGLGRPGAATRLREGENGVLFASTELADLFPGYIDGAIRAGVAAARSAVQNRKDHRDT